MVEMVKVTMPMNVGIALQNLRAHLLAEVVDHREVEEMMGHLTDTAAEMLCDAIKETSTATWGFEPTEPQE